MVSKGARKTLEAHIAAERAHDLDAMLAALSDNRRYMMPNYLLEGRVAIGAMYERNIRILSDDLSDEYLRALDDPKVIRWGDAHCVIEYMDDYPLHRGMIVVVHFDGDRVKSENTYFTSTARISASVMDEDFIKVPGVTRLG